MPLNNASNDNAIRNNPRPLNIIIPPPMKSSKKGFSHTIVPKAVGNGLYTLQFIYVQVLGPLPIYFSLIGP